MDTPTRNELEDELLYFVDHGSFRKRSQYRQYDQIGMSLEELALKYLELRESDLRRGTDSAQTFIVEFADRHQCSDRTVRRWINIGRERLIEKSEQEQGPRIKGLG